MPPRKDFRRANKANGGDVGATLAIPSNSVANAANAGNAAHPANIIKKHPPMKASRGHNNGHHDNNNNNHNNGMVAANAATVAPKCSNNAGLTTGFVQPTADARQKVSLSISGRMFDATFPASRRSHSTERLSCFQFICKLTRQTRYSLDTSLTGPFQCRWRAPFAFLCFSSLFLLFLLFAHWKCAMLANF